MFNKKNIAISCIILLLFLLLTSIIFAKNNTDINIIEIGEDATLTIKKNQIVLNDIVLTSSSENKKYPVISPDRKRIAFAYEMNLSNEIWGEFGVIDIKTGDIKDIFLEGNYANAFMDIEWINNNKIAITGHRNPSLQTYEIYNVNSGKRLEIFYGIGFNWNKTKEYLLYTVPAPHFAPKDKGANKIVDMNGQVLYESGKDKVVLGGASISDSEDKVVFFESDYHSENKDLVVAKLEKGKSIKIQNRIKWNHIDGEIEWMNNGQIKVKNSYSNIVYDINSEEILQLDTEGHNSTLSEDTEEKETTAKQQVEEEKEVKLFDKKLTDINNDGIDESISIFEYQGEYTTEFKLKIQINEHEQIFDTNTLPYQTKNNYGIKHFGEGVIEFYDKASQVYAKYNVITSEDLKNQYYPGLNMLKDYKIPDTMAIINYYNIQIKDINLDNIDEIICSKFIPGVYHRRVFGEIDYIFYFENDKYTVKKQTLRHDERLELPEIELNSYKSDIQ